MSNDKIPEKLLKSFPNFLYATWKVLGLPPPDPIQIDMARTLQYGPNRLILEAFRGVGKSYITGAFLAWLLLNDPDLSILVLSASGDKANDLSQFVYRLLAEAPFLNHLQPMANQRSSMMAFDVAGARVKQSPSVRSKGITGTITGGRADVILADDIEVPENSQTQTMRDKIREKVRELDNIIKPGPTPRIIYLGTPQLEDSLYGVLPERGYKVFVWPVRYPNAEGASRYAGRLSPRIIEAVQGEPGLAGKPTEPRRFSEFVIQEKELTQGRSGFRLQYMLDTSLSDMDRYPLKLSDLVVMNLNPERAPEKVIWAKSPELVWKGTDLPNVGLQGDLYYRPMGYEGQRDADGRVMWQPYTGSVLAIDPSGRGRDETGWAVTKMLNSQIFVTAAGGFIGGYEEKTLQSLAVIAKLHQVNYVIVEANFGDGMWLKLFQPVLNKIYPVMIEEVKASNRMFKEQRIIDILEPVMNMHRLIIDKKVIEQDFQSTQHLSADQAMKYQLFYQLTRITKERGALRHDDRVEALAWAVWYWVQQMAGDHEKAIKTRREQFLQNEIDEFFKHALGGPKPKPLTWM